MLRAGIATLIVAGGVLASGYAVFGGDACSRAGSGGYALLVGSVLFGVAGFIGARRLGWTKHTSGGAAIATAVATCFLVGMVVLFFRWIPECAN